MSDETTNTDQGVAGVGLLVAAYVDERADNALDSLKQAKKAGEFYDVMPPSCATAQMAISTPKRPEI